MKGGFSFHPSDEDPSPGTQGRKSHTTAWTLQTLDVKMMQPEPLSWCVWRWLLLAIQATAGTSLFMPGLTSVPQALVLPIMGLR